jgi:prepilin-type N-terminal cleavage/methylation domain-containing protein
MRNRKGFSLVEVLLVIDILVIISLIAIPIIQTSLEGVKRKAFENDTKTVLRAAEISLRKQNVNSLTCYSLHKVDISFKDKFLTAQICKDENDNININNLCTNSYCFNGNVETSTITQYNLSSIPEMIKMEHSTGFYKDDVYRNNIVTATIVDHTNVPSDSVITWDVSKNQNNSVKAWLTNAESGKYHLFIGGNGGVKPNTDMRQFLSNLKSLREVNLEHLHTSHVTQMGGAFSDLDSLTELDLSNFDTRNVWSFRYMFNWSKSLQHLDLSSFNTSKATEMQYFFRGCHSLVSIDLSSFNTSKTTNMAFMFAECNSLLELDLSSFDTRNVEYMESLFFKCLELRSLDLSSFNTSKVKNMDSMFAFCRKMTTLDLSHFNTSKVTNMGAMFQDLYKITSLDVSSFDTSQVTNMAFMFSYYQSLPYLDLRSFDTSKVNNFRYMFHSQSANKIDVTTGKWVISAGANVDEMFRWCNAGDVTYN